MELSEAMKQRHSVRQYTDKPIEAEALHALQEEIKACNKESGLHTCWVAMTYKKVPGTFQIGNGEKLTVVIALGYGQTSGVAHKSKSAEAVSNLDSSSPAWFKAGIEAALLAPTAMNQQKFKLHCEGNTVSAKAGTGFYTKLDLGIVKYHFELGAGKENFQWS